MVGFHKAVVTKKSQPTLYQVLLTHKTGLLITEREESVDAALFTALCIDVKGEPLRADVLYDDAFTLLSFVDVMTCIIPPLFTHIIM